MDPRMAADISPTGDVHQGGEMDLPPARNMLNGGIPQPQQPVTPRPSDQIMGQPPAADPFFAPEGAGNMQPPVEMDVPSPRERFESFTQPKPQPQPDVQTQSGFGPRDAFWMSQAHQTQNQLNGVLSQLGLNNPNQLTPELVSNIRQSFAKGTEQEEAPGPPPIPEGGIDTTDEDGMAKLGDWMHQLIGYSMNDHMSKHESRRDLMDSLAAQHPELQNPQQRDNFLKFMEDPGNWSPEIFYQVYNQTQQQAAGNNMFPPQGMPPQGYPQQPQQPPQMQPQPQMPQQPMMPQPGQPQVPMQPMSPQFAQQPPMAPQWNPNMYYQHPYGQPPTIMNVQPRGFPQQPNQQMQPGMGDPGDIEFQKTIKDLHDKSRATSYL